MTTILLVGYILTWRAIVFICHREVTTRRALRPVQCTCSIMSFEITEKDEGKA
jgi:hypothetical protein